MSAAHCTLMSDSAYIIDTNRPDKSVIQNDTMTHAALTLRISEYRMNSLVAMTL